MQVLDSRSVNSGPGALVISLDFELFWGVRDVVSLDAYRANVEGVHEAVPRLLDLFSSQGIHATWACVGLVLASDAEEARHYAPALWPTYERHELSPYPDLSRAELEVHPKCFFAPNLVRAIAAHPGQELATHTYSHFYCTEAGQSAEQFGADLDAAIAISAAHQFRPTSLVFPRNQCNDEYLPVLRQKGIRRYRGVAPRWAHQAGTSRAGTLARRAVRLADNYAPLCRDYSPRVATPGGAPVDVVGNRFLRPHVPALRRLDELRYRRIRGEMTRAARTGGVYHLWWHPHNFGTHTSENLAFLERLFGHVARLRDAYGFRSANMAEVAGDHAGP